jgi:hypothetical protein
MSQLRQVQRLGERATKSKALWKVVLKGLSYDAAVAVGRRYAETRSRLVQYLSDRDAIDHPR